MHLEHLVAENAALRARIEDCEAAVHGSVGRLLHRHRQLQLSQCAQQRNFRRDEQLAGERCERVAKRVDLQVARLQQTLEGLEDRAQTRAEELRDLLVFRATGQFSNMRTLCNLRTALQRLRQDHEQELAGMAARMDHERDVCAKHARTSLEEAQSRVTERAVLAMDWGSKSKALENVDLRREIQTHKGEYEEATRHLERVRCEHR